MTTPATSIAFFGPQGTFTEEALLTQPDYAAAALEPAPTIAEVLDAVAAGQVDLGFVPIENAIEGTVNATLDALIFDFDLLIQREVVLDMHLHLMAPPGTELSDVRRVVSFPVRHWPSAGGTWPRSCPGAEAAGRPTRPPTPPGSWGSTPSRARAAIAPRLAAELYGLAMLADDVEDYAGNQTRFVAVARHGRRPAHRARPHQHRVLPARRPTRAASTGSSASSPPATSTSPSSSPARPSAASATTASSSTSTGTWTTRWWPTASGTCTPSWPG